MQVELLHYTPSNVLIEAMSMPYKTDNFRNSDLDTAMKKIKAICVGKKHGSVLEHISFNYKVTGLSRLALQECVRHRLASYTVESTRYTIPKPDKANELYELISDIISSDATTDTSSYPEIYSQQEVLDIVEQYIVIPKHFDNSAKMSLVVKFMSFLNNILYDDLKNDDLKYYLPESWKTNLVMSINIRSLLNFLYFRDDAKAHFEIRELAQKMKELIPNEYKILFEERNND